MNPEIIIGAVTAIASLVLPVAILWIVFGPGSNSASKKLEQWGSAAVAGPINTAIDAWVKVALIATALGVGVWVLESELSSRNPHLRQGGVIPGTAPPPPPTFGAAGGIGFQKGGFGVQQGVSAGGPGAPQVQYVDTGSGSESRAGYRGYSPSYRGERRPSRAERRTDTQANVAENRARIAAAQAKEQKARSGGGYTRRRSA